MTYVQILAENVNIKSYQKRKILQVFDKKHWEILARESKKRVMSIATQQNTVNLEIINAELRELFNFPTQNECYYELISYICTYIGKCRKQTFGYIDHKTKNYFYG